MVEKVRGPLKSKEGLSSLVVGSVIVETGEPEEKWGVEKREERIKRGKQESAYRATRNLS